MPRRNKPVDPEISNAASIMGKVGGRKATGAKKRRSSEHYEMLGNIRRQKRLERAQKNLKAISPKWGNVFA